VSNLQTIPDGTIVCCGSEPPVQSTKQNESVPTSTQQAPEEEREILLGSREAWEFYYSNIEKSKKFIPNDKLIPATATRSPSSTFQVPEENEFSKTRRSLPAYQYKDRVVEACRSHRVVIVSAETGAGKSTQVPQFILDNNVTKKIIVTQPRRIAAISLADRVAKERGQSVGDEVGYCVRLDKRPGQRLEFVTVGVLLQRLQVNRDYLKQEVSHVIVDEAHERDALTDFLLILLRDELKRSPDWTLVVMSATLDAALFTKYFHPDSCLISIPGRLFPVEEKFVDQLQGVGISRKDVQQLIKNAQVTTIKTNESFLSPECNAPLDCAVVARITAAIASKYPSATLLIFAPGVAEIDKICRELKGLRIPILPLHGSLPASQQRLVFRPGRKIVVATNVAETSITIPEVGHVIDTGRVREIRHNNNVTKLAECWVSKSAARQRAGRAGRVASGIVWRLYPHTLFDSPAMPEHAAAEMLRTPLDELVLKILRLGLGQPRSFLRKAIEPPSAISIDNALQQLWAIGAICHSSDKDEEAYVDEDANDEEDIDDDEDCDQGPWAEENELFSASNIQSYHIMSDEENNVVADDSGADDKEKVEENWELTVLGYHVASLPMDSKLAKLLIYGCLFECVETTLTVAAALSATKQCFSAPSHLRRQADVAKQRLARGSDSDLIAVCHAYADWLSASDKYQSCRDNFTSHQSLSEIDNLRRDFRHRLIDAGWLSSKDKTTGNLVSELRYSLSTAKPLLAAALYPQLARLVKSNEQNRRQTYLVDRNKRKWYCHPSSVNFELLHKQTQHVRYLVFAGHIVTTKPYLCDTNLIDAVGLLLFGGRLTRSADSQYLLLDDWIPFKLTQHAALCICALKREIDATLARHINRDRDIRLEKKPLPDSTTVENEEEEEEKENDNLICDDIHVPSSQEDSKRIHALASETVSTVKYILALLSAS